MNFIATRKSKSEIKEFF